MVYDALDRNVSTILPDNTETTIDYDIDLWDGGNLTNYFITKVTDANLKKKTTYRDTREWVVRVRSCFLPSTYIISV